MQLPLPLLTDFVGKLKRKLFVVFILLFACFCYADPVPNQILEGGNLSRDFLVDFLLKNNPSLNRSRAISIVELYISEANDEGVNY